MKACKVLKHLLFWIGVVFLILSFDSVWTNYPIQSNDLIVCNLFPALACLFMCSSFIAMLYEAFYIISKEKN